MVHSVLKNGFKVTRFRESRVCYKETNTTASATIHLERWLTLCRYRARTSTLLYMQANVSDGANPSETLNAYSILQQPDLN